jgi:hypothetical protein
MSNRRLRGDSKLPRRSEPIAAAQSMLSVLSDLSGIRKVSYRTPLPVRPRGNPRMVADYFCKDGVVLRVQGGGLRQEVYIKCENSRAAKQVFETAWVIHKSALPFYCS